MLRASVIVVGAIALLGGLVGLFFPWFPPAAIFAVWGALLLVGTLWERVRYKNIESDRPGSEWVATEERFVDDETGRLVTVFVERRTGERKYVSV